MRNTILVILLAAMVIYLTTSQGIPEFKGIMGELKRPFSLLWWLCGFSAGIPFGIWREKKRSQAST